jgi:regulator of sigma E protease
MLAQLPSLILLVLGFGFVIFFHELGHFLAAKWVGIKVEQFAVGFGQALLAWRKGVGLRVGTTTPEYERKINEYLRSNNQTPAASAPNAPDEESQAHPLWSFHQIDQAQRALGLSETEYRLNWIPLGGYVKMMGQDDLRPNAEQDDPRAYNRKSIPARMFVVSAGVIMNVILAAIGFMVVFMMGFRVQPAVVGSVIPDSPAAHATTLDGKPAPLQVGDRIEMYDGKWQHDFTKITLNVALSGEGEVPILVKRVDGQEQRLLINPKQEGANSNGFLMIGVGPPMALEGLDPKSRMDEDLRREQNKEEFVPADYLAVQPGDVITAVNGQPVKVHEYWKLDRAVQASNGKPIQLTIAEPNGKTHQELVHPSFMNPFGPEPLNFAGMEPRTVIEQVNTNSSAKGKLLPGDVVLAMSFQNGDRVSNPTVDEVRDRLEDAGQNSQPVSFTILRDDKTLEVKDLMPNVHIAKGQYGLSVALSVDDTHPVVAATMEKSPAQEAGIPAGTTITAINGKPVANWFDVKRILASTEPDTAVELAGTTAVGPRTFSLKLAPSEVRYIAGLRYSVPLALHDYISPRKADNPLQAAAWGVTETRDFILQFYLTIHRMVQGTVSYKNMMGPVGIFNAGRQFAYKGMDWLVWFLAMISANLAVVNFLPIPIVDGGLFVFLIVEKLQGRPLSAKTQSIAQVVGLAIILSVFLLVTYQDIARMVL